jgi:transposase
LPAIGRARSSSSSGMSWVVERAFSHLHNFRRLRTRYERDPDQHLAMLHLACSIMCWRRLSSL